MNSNLEFSKYTRNLSVTLLNAKHTRNGQNQNTFAELSLSERIATVNQWLSQSKDHPTFAGCVSFYCSDHESVDTSKDDGFIVCENQDWRIKVPLDPGYSAFSTLLESKIGISNLTTLTQAQTKNLANIVAMISTRYDNLMMSSVTLVIDWIFSDGKKPSVYAVISPEVRQSEGLFGSQRFIVSDFTPEQTARRLRNLSDIHFRDIFA